MITTSDIEIVASLAPEPIAIPISADAITGASLSPSPMKAILSF